MTPTTFILFIGFLAIALGQPLSSRIVNGQNAEPGEIPYQASLKFGSHFCGGSIISENYVVTAAHCLYKRKASHVRVYVGDVSLRQSKISRKAEKLIVHEKFNLTTITYDIALIKVKKPFVFNELIKPVPLPEPHFRVKTNSTAIVSGWGATKAGGSVVDHLQKAEVFIVDPDYCREAMKGTGYSIYDTNVCAYNPIVRRGQCSGDSGGPLTVDGVLTGIVSWSIKDPDCASTKYPGVYTRVSEFVDWIKENSDV